jgi:hypothetical protein
MFSLLLSFWFLDIWMKQIHFYMCNSPYIIFQKECFVELGLNTGQLGIDDSTQVPPGEYFPCDI